MTSKLALTPARFALLAALAVAGCAERDVILPGPRFDPRAVTSPDGPAVEQPAAGGAQLSLPGARANAEWTHRAANAAHNSGHVAMGAGTQRIFSVPIGQAADRRHRISADPVVAGGRIFALDSRATITAVSLAGSRAWSVDLTPPGERNAGATGGGIAYEAGRVFVTTGYGELVALDVQRGAVLWRQRVGAPIGGAPTVSNGVVYVTDRGANGYAVRASDGKLQWQISGIQQPTAVTGVAAPAVEGNLVVFPFSSGQVLAVDTQTGVENWSGQVAGSRVGRAAAYIRDMTGEPVIAGNMVYAGTSAGRIAALDRTTGQQIWSAREGAISPVLPEGNAIFAVNDQNQLVRLDAATGGLVWARDLPYFVDKKVKKQDRIYAQYGPVLAGGRLFVSSSDGILRSFDPASGNLVGHAEIPGGAASAPVVAGGTLYVTGRDGNLHAFR